jgi:hypothetical protein
MADQLCGCGRSSVRVHCPRCGRASRIYCYAPSKRLDTVTRDTGEVVQLHVYRCSICGVTFNEDDWKLRCTAPRNAPTNLVGSMLEAAKQFERDKIVAEKFGGDYDAYMHSLLPKKDKPLRPIAGPLTSRIPESEKSMSDEQAEEILRQMNEETNK